MTKLNILRKRFFEETPRDRLGHLASSLLRIATFSESGMHEQARSVIFEGKYFAEWSAPDCDLRIQMELAEIQSFLALKELQWASWHRGDQVLSEASMSFRRWSERLLRSAGYL